MEFYCPVAFRLGRGTSLAQSHLNSELMLVALSQSGGLNGLRKRTDFALRDTISHSLLPSKNSLLSHLNHLNQVFPADLIYFDVSKHNIMTGIYLMTCITCSIVLSLGQKKSLVMSFRNFAQEENKLASSIAL